MADGNRRGAKGSIYAYRTAAGTRYRFVFRNSRGKQTSKNGFLSRAAARRERKRLMGRVHRGEVRVSRERWRATGCATSKRESPTSRAAPGRTTAVTASCASCPTSGTAS